MDERAGGGALTGGFRIPVLLLVIGSAGLRAQALEDVLVYGQNGTHPAVILRELEIGAGSRFDDFLLRRERDWLIRLDFLKRIDFLIKSGSAPGRQILMIVIRERKPFSFSPSLDVDDRFGLSQGGSVTAPNMWGRRERIRISGMAGGFRQLDVSWKNPWLAGPLHLFIEIRAGYRNFDYLYPDWNRPFRETDLTAGAVFGRQWGRRIRTGAGIGFERIRVSDPEVALSGANKDDIPVFSLFAEYDSRDWPFYPRTGLFWRSGADQYHLPSDGGLRRTFMDLRSYVPIGGQQVLALQIAGRFSQGRTPVYKRVHLGGSRTVRGYATGKEAGENIVHASLEYRFPWLYERNPSAGLHFGINGVFFVDAGAVWWNEQHFDLKSVRGSAGFGVHLIWDQWVIRAEYGAHGRDWGFISTGTDLKF